MKFNQLRILTYLTEAVKADLKITNSAVKDVLAQYWNEIPEDVDFIVNTLDGIEGKLFLHNNSREKIKIHKVLTQMLPTKDNKEINKIIDEFKAKESISIDDPKFKGFEVWKGSIFDLYEECYNNDDTQSCMTGDRVELTKFYDWINGSDPNYQPSHDVKVRGLVNRDTHSNVLGRALVWEGVDGISSKYFMDRVYPEAMTELFQQYAEANGWAYRVGRGVDCKKISDSGSSGDRIIQIHINAENMNPRQLVPFMDTFMAANDFDPNTGLVIFRNKHDNVEFSKDLQRTTGSQIVLQLHIFPDWIRNNQKNILDDPSIYMVDSKYVVFENGTWKDGTWENGTWKNSVWQNGTWKTGFWTNGFWVNGTWENGTWEDGIWEGGTWENGTWEKGTWKKGDWLGGTWKGGIWQNGTWNGGTWERGIWIIGEIYDPNKLGVPFWMSRVPREGDFVISKESPAIYFGQQTSPYTK